MKKLTLMTLFSFITVGFMMAQTLDSKPLTNVSTSLKDYCGTYKMAENPYVSEVKIAVKDGKLMSKTPEDEEVVFEHSEDDSFFIPTINATVTFIREKDIINGVKVAAQGKEMLGSKEK
jgi:Domain of unknown function (DUF3471)